jgi:hypothetical protein
MARSLAPHRGTACVQPPAPAGPVLLATLGVCFDPAAERIAVASALDAGVRLVVANMLELQPLPLTMMVAREHATLPHEEDLEAVRGTAARTAARGIPTELLRVSSPRPVTALLELSAELGAALLVFGPDRRRLSRWRFRSASRAVRKRAGCLVWISE